MNQRGAWTDGVSRRLIHSAARRAPDALSERLEEEWLADLSARPHGASRLRFAIGCCWATRVIAYDHQPSRVPAAGTVTVSKLAIASGQFNVGQFSRRSTTAFLVVTLHVGLFYVLMTKLSHTHFTAPPPPFKVAIIDEPTPKLERLHAEPRIERTAIEAQRPVIDLVRDEDPRRPQLVGETPPEIIDTPPVQREVPPAHVVQRAAGGPGVGFPSADRFYPDAAKRLAEQGSATVRVCVDPKGRLTSDPSTVQGTGSERLDEAALNLARAGSGHYRASTEDGQPVDSCYPFKIRFQLRN